MEVKKADAVLRKMKLKAQTIMKEKKEHRLMVLGCVSP